MNDGCQTSRLRRTVRTWLIACAAFFASTVVWEYVSLAGLTSPLDAGASGFVLAACERAAIMSIVWALLMFPVFWWLSQRRTRQRAA